MRESFVFHAEYIEDLPDEYRPTFLLYIYEYGINDIVPELSGLESAIWKKIQRRIDADREAWAETCRKRSEAGKKHSGNQYSKKQQMEQSPNEMEQMEQCSKYSNEMEQNGTNGTESVSDIESEFVNESVTATATEFVAQVPESLPLSSQNYAKNILDKYQKAGLPCFNGNLISFMQTDFKNALPYLRGIHSDKVLQALDNYIQVLNAPDCWVDRKLKFDSLVKSDMWARLLPDNFDRSYFEYGAEKARPKDIPKAEKPKISFFEKYNAPKRCTKCNAKMVSVPGSSPPAIQCSGCGQWAELEGGKWQWPEMVDIDFGKLTASMMHAG